MTHRSKEAIAASARALRREIRAGRWRKQTSGVAPGALQVNLAILPADVADAFRTFCASNPRPCPLLARSEPGSRAFPTLAEDLDIARDAPFYRVIRDGEPAEKVADLEAIWREDFVSFALGCSFSFEDAMARAGVEVRHMRLGRNVPMYVSDIETIPVPPFSGPTVVSMRPIPPERADEVREICLGYPTAHGAPVHIGDPAEIGIREIETPDFGDPPVIEEGEVCAFWACGVTPRLALGAARLEIAITHEPGHMLVAELDAADPGLPEWESKPSAAP